MSEYKTSNNKRFRYVFHIIDNFSKYLGAIPLQNSFSETVTQDSSNILTKAKRSPLKIENDRGAEFYNSILQNFLYSFLYSFFYKYKHYSRFTDKGPSIAERVIRTVRNLLKTPVFEKCNAKVNYHLS